MTTKKTFNFSEKFTDLEELVASFEDQEIDLDKAIKKFEERLKRAHDLKKHLKLAENKIETLKQKFS